ncbi:hypothetical protein CLU96_1220 [Chryseobacterium sp. 52]|nr:hypothetical protein CLU96_1220 [Chryseobacterium sp. 52]
MKLSIKDLSAKINPKVNNVTRCDKPVKPRKCNNSKRPKKRK